jgi:hypothetical protein
MLPGSVAPDRLRRALLSAPGANIGFRRGRPRLADRSGLRRRCRGAGRHSRVRACDPQAQMMTRLIADRQAALERLLVSARALADAPIWLVGPAPEIEAAMPQLTPGQASGVLVTSVTSSAGSCSRTVVYSNPGTGAEPRVTVRTQGTPAAHPRRSACAPLPRACFLCRTVNHRRRGSSRPRSPTLSPAAQQPLIRHVAEEIRGLPSS